MQLTPIQAKKAALMAGLARIKAEHPEASVTLDRQAFRVEYNLPNAVTKEGAFAKTAFIYADYFAELYHITPEEYLLASYK